MKTKFTLLFLFIFFAVVLRAQTYTMGDLSVTLSWSAVHDSVICASKEHPFYDIIIQNSFTGDSVKLMDLNNFTFFAAENTTGQSPWIISQEIYTGVNAVADMYLYGGPATFQHGTMYAISGADTIYFPNTVYTLPVPNPCEVSTYSGRVYIDNNNNCIYDAGDFPVFVQVDDSTSYTPGYLIYQGVNTDTAGYYNLSIQKTWLGTGYVYLSPAYQFIFPSSSCSPVVRTYNTLPQTNLDFALQCSGLTDLMVWQGTPPGVRPQVPFHLSVAAGSSGCIPVSGILSLVLDPRVTYNPAQSTNPADSISGDTLFWYFNNLSNVNNGFYWYSFLRSISLTPNAGVNIGDTLCFQIFSSIPSGDINPQNNYEAFCIPVTNSCDPNLKTVSPKGEGALGIISASTPELTYTIHFQNTGNAPAFTVAVLDTLDPNLQDSTLQIIGSSHAMTPEWIAPGIVDFRFNNINLPDSTSNGPESNGSLSFKIKLKPTLQNGTQIRNTAAIYFDYNEPVLTNTTLNTIGIPSNIQPVSEIAAFKVFPNPSAGMITVALFNDLKNYTLKLTNITGETVIDKPNLSGTSQTFDLSTQPAGFYWIELTHNAAVSRVKVVVVKH